jgi:hypothetical protein
MQSAGCSGQIYGFTASWQGKQLKGASDTLESAGLTNGCDNFNRLASMSNSSGILYNYNYARSRD